MRSLSHSPISNLKDVTMWDGRSSAQAQADDEREERLHDLAATIAYHAPHAREYGADEMDVVGDHIDLLVRTPATTLDGVLYKASALAGLEGGDMDAVETAMADDTLSPAERVTASIIRDLLSMYPPKVPEPVRSWR